MKKYESFTDLKAGKLRGLRHREDQGRFWWELRPCAYYDLFARPKLIYQAIQFYARYTFDDAEVYGNNKTTSWSRMTAPFSLSSILLRYGGLVGGTSST